MTTQVPAQADIVIVGAGLAGLAAAKRLTASGRSPLVIEAADGVGGRVRTDHVDGFLLDRGFQILLTAYPEVQDQLDLDALDLRPFRPGASIWLEGKGNLVGDPFRDRAALVPTIKAPFGSPIDKLRVLQLRRRLCTADPRELMRGADQSTAAYLKQLGFSQKAIERFFRPLFAGIQLDPSLQTSRRMFDIIFRSLSLGDAAVPATGMGAIPEQLASHLDPAQLLLECPVSSIEGTQVHTPGGVITASEVVVATDGAAANKLIGVETTGSRSVGCLWFGADRSPVDDALIVLDGSGAGPVLNLAVLSDVAPEYAPADRSLIAAATPGDIGENLESDVTAQLKRMFGAQVDGWELLRTDRIAHAQPDQAPPFSPKRRVQLDDHLWVCGDHRDTGSIQGAMYSGRRTAEAIIAASG